MQFDAFPHCIFFWTINKFLRVFCSVKTDEGNDGSASSLSLSGQHTFACSLRQVPIRSMQQVLVTNKQRPVQGLENAVAHLRRTTENVECANVFLPFFSCIWTLHGNGCMCALLQIAVRYQHSQNILHPWSRYKILIKTFCNLTLWMTHCLGCPGPSPRSCPLCTSYVKTLCKFYRCSTSMRNILHPLRTLDFRPIVTQPGVKPRGRLLLETETPPWNVS